MKPNTSGKNASVWAEEMFWNCSSVAVAKERLQNQSINQSINQPIQKINQTNNGAFNQLITQLLSNQSIVNKSLSALINQFVSYC